jgi:hypothetical protein
MKAELDRAEEFIILRHRTMANRTEGSVIARSESMRGRKRD